MESEIGFLKKDVKLTNTQLSAIENELEKLNNDIVRLTSGEKDQVETESYEIKNLKGKLFNERIYKESILESFHETNFLIEKKEKEKLKLIKDEADLNQKENSTLQKRNLIEDMIRVLILTKGRKSKKVEVGFQKYKSKFEELLEYNSKLEVTA